MRSHAKSLPVPIAPRALQAALARRDSRGEKRRIGPEGSVGQASPAHAHLAGAIFDGAERARCRMRLSARFAREERALGAMRYDWRDGRVRPFGGRGAIPVLDRAVQGARVFGACERAREGHFNGRVAHGAPMIRFFDAPHGGNDALALVGCHAISPD